MSGLPTMEQKERFERVSLALFAVALAMGAMASAHGQMFFPDEQRYFYDAQHLLLALLKPFMRTYTADAPHHFLWETVITAPLYYLATLPVTALNWLIHGVNPGSASVEGIGLKPSWFLLPSLFNVLCYAMSGRLLFRLAQMLFRNPPAALLAQLLFTLWPQHLLYTRHILPYSLAEMLLLASAVGLASAVQSPERPLNFLKAGFRWAAQALAYMGYYYTLPLAAGVILAQPGTWGQRLWRLLLFAVPSALLVALLEVTSQLLFKHSYFQWLRYYSSTISMGDYHQGWRFPLEYGWLISPPLVMVIVLGLGWTLSRLHHKDGFRSGNAVPAVALLGLYGMLVLQSDVLCAMVPYARTIPPLLIPGILLASRLLAEGMASTGPGLRWGHRILSALCCLSLLPACVELLKLSYPTDQNEAFRQKTGIFLPDRFLSSSRSPDNSILVAQPDPNRLVLLSRTVSTQSLSAPDPVDCRRLKPLPASAQTFYVLLNREYISQFGSGTAISPELERTGTILFNAPHPLKFALYQYEGYKADERERIRRSDFRMLTVENPCR